MSEENSDKYYEVTKKAAKGIGWHSLSFGGTKILSLLTLSILARLLLPESFGIVALATITMDYLSIISDLGFSAALIQKKDRLIESANISFIINFLANAFLSLLVFFVAPYAALFFREPELTSVLRWLGLTFVLKSIGTVHNVLLEKELNFKKKLIPDLGSSIVKAIVSIILAFMGYGVWALVAGQLIGLIASSILLWYLVTWRPAFHWDSKIAKELFTYGFSIMGVSALNALGGSFDYLIIGRIFDATALGIYTIAYRLPETLILNTMWVLTAVLFPTFSALQYDKDALKKGFLSSVRYVEILVTPLCVGMIIAARPLILVAFGEQWIDAIPILQIISLYTLVISIGYHAGDIYKAVGRPDIVLKVAISMFPIRLLCLWVGAQFGLIGVAYGHLTAEVIWAVINLTVIRKFINLTLFEFVRELKAFIGGITIIICAVPVLYATHDFLPVYQLFLTALAGAIGYALTIWIIERKSVEGFIDLMGLGHFLKLNR